MIKYLTGAVIAAAAVLSLAFISAPGEESKASDQGKNLGEKPVPKCFFADQVDSFSSINDHSILIRDRFNHAYRLEVSGYCPSLDHSFRLAVVARHGMSQVCGAFDADIVIADTGFGGPESCSVTEVTPLSASEARALESGKSNSEGQKPDHNGHKN